MYVNRSLNFANIRLIGFDMDHTLAPYNRETFEALAFQETLAKFIESGYPEELSRLEFRSNSVIRGLLVDRERGNVLKVDGHKYVKSAYHGYQKLSKEERNNLYNRTSFKAEKFLSVDTFFALSEVQLFVEIVDFMRKNPNRIQKSFLEVYHDLREFIDLSHRDGSIKTKVLANPEKYILKDKYLATALVRQLDAGKSLFLLTNSRYEYTDHIMSYVLDGAHEEFSNWKDYWDHMIVGSGKPGFFLGSQPFFEVIENSDYLKLHEGNLQKQKIYHGGNAKLFQKLAGYRGDEILYIGDHIYGDIIQSKGALNWRTLLIVEELEEELPKLEFNRPLLNEINQKVQQRETIDEGLQKTRSIMAANSRRAEKSRESGNQRKAEALEVENEKLYQRFSTQKQKLDLLESEIANLVTKREHSIHPVWGDLMKVGLERSRFAHQVSSYACLYTSRVSNLRFYSPYKRFISFHEVLPHEE